MWAAGAGLRGGFWSATARAGVPVPRPEGELLLTGACIAHGACSLGPTTLSVRRTGAPPLRIAVLCPAAPTAALAIPMPVPAAGAAPEQFTAQGPAAVHLCGLLMRPRRPRPPAPGPSPPAPAPSPAARPAAAPAPAQRAAAAPAAAAADAGSEEELPAVRCGRVKLLSGAAEFRAAFSRFEGDPLNGWTPAKDRRRGQSGVVAQVFDDETCTVVFADGKKMDFPFAAVAKQLSVDEHAEELARRAAVAATVDTHPADAEKALIAVLRKAGGSAPLKQVSEQVNWRELRRPRAPGAPGLGGLQGFCAKRPRFAVDPAGATITLLPPSEAAAGGAAAEAAGGEGAEGAASAEGEEAEEAEEGEEGEEGEETASAGGGEAEEDDEVELPEFQVTKNAEGKLGMSLDAGSMAIVSVAPGGPAEAAGLRPGMLIVGVDGATVSGLAEYRSAVAAGGSTVALLVVDPSQEQVQPLAGGAERTQPPRRARPPDSDDSDAEIDSDEAAAWEKPKPAPAESDSDSGPVEVAVPAAGRKRKRGGQPDLAPVPTAAQKQGKRRRKGRADSGRPPPPRRDPAEDLKTGSWTSALQEVSAQGAGGGRRGPQVR
eukprot:TRINITY_DN55302_c0_g1_i1.p2 TRINITY_DN55302_c0_g1~~TRINITY_DN55302_c0_g1_i1.p2  ORF type:complete len:625 (+),score=205.43 TRINITY_DN55302_c0_g1_i1:74-1876(+)